MSQTICKRSIPFGRPWVSEEDRQAVARVLSGHILTHGPECAAFEKEFAHFMGPEAHCVTVSSGMAALHLAYLHFGIAEGDEVVVPAMTHIATIHAVEWVGATPVFIDCNPSTGNVTAAAITAAITSRTKAISVVHFQGIPCDMSEIMEVAETHDLKVIEDCALAVGARYEGRHVGLFGDAACFSFYPVKHLTCGEGGMFATRHEDVAVTVNKLRAFGVDRKYEERNVPGMYDVPQLGLNYRMSEMQAALGRSQLTRIDEILRRRGDNFAALKQGLSLLPNIRVLDSTCRKAINSHYSLTLVLEKELKSYRNEVIWRLKEAGIGTSIYYPQPTPRMTYYRNKYDYDFHRYPAAIEISDHSIALPVGPHIEPDDIQYILDQTSEILVEVSR
jgi:dTDP-4-amino-4,6-dideoxygalactose transaminase